MNKYTTIARKAIEKFVKEGKVVASDDINIINKQAGCFVSIHTKLNDLRGCIGTIVPTCTNLTAEIINNAISACQDSRFERLKEEELKTIKISVDILSEPEHIASPESLDPKKYGVIVKSNDGRTGVLLPNLEGIHDAMYQIAIARDKAGISPEEPVFLYRFTSERFNE